MPQNRQKKHYEAQDSQIQVDFITDRGQFRTAHYVKGIEMVFLLNGNAVIQYDGKPLNLVQGEFIVIGSGHIYEMTCREQFMEIRVHVNGDFLASRAGLVMQAGQTGWASRCLREELTHEQLEPYLSMCELFKALVLLYINEPSGFRLKTESIVLDLLFFIIRYFTFPVFEGEDNQPAENRQRIQEILDYIEEHYNEEIPLERIAGHFALTREYFSRFFKRSLGITFSQHLSRVRISHFYMDLISTDTPVMELLELHGITNYRLFSRTFKDMYGFTPREVRKMG